MAYLEDAPAPMALHSFQTQVKDGKIFVTANTDNTLKANISRQPRLLATGVNATGKGVVIVGGGSGAFNAIESLREVRALFDHRRDSTETLLAWLFEPHHGALQGDIPSHR